MDMSRVIRNKFVAGGAVLAAVAALIVFALSNGARSKTNYTFAKVSKSSLESTISSSGIPPGPPPPGGLPPK